MMPTTATSFSHKNCCQWCARFLESFSFSNRMALQQTGHDSVKLLEREIPAFISPAMWPPNSPDLNPVDYRIWGGGWCSSGCFRLKIHSGDQLKQRLVDVWRSIEQNIIDSTIDEWRKRLTACVRARGGHIEHMLWFQTVCVSCFMYTNN